jgi:hypothetical protein
MIVYAMLVYDMIEYAMLVYDIDLKRKLNRCIVL